MTETVLVTGGTGYVSSWAIVRLLEHDYRVRTTVRDPARLAPHDGLTVHRSDLLDDAGWAEALDGVDHVLHVASPLGGTDDLLRPAREGTLRVLCHAAAAGVRRVVMTSAATASAPADLRAASVTDEKLWTDADGRQLSDYQRSKVLAERAAWDYAASAGLELTTVLPGAVLGPIVSTASRGSTYLVERLLTGSMPGLPDVMLEIVDVRDLVDLHLLAMTAPEAAGQRFLGVGGELTSMREIAATLHAHLGEAAARVPTRRIPDLAVRAAARFRPDLRTLTTGLGRRHRHSNAKARESLGWKPRPTTETILATAESLIAHGVV